MPQVGGGCKGGGTHRDQATKQANLSKSPERLLRASSRTEFPRRVILVGLVFSILHNVTYQTDLQNHSQREENESRSLHVYHFHCCL